MPDANDKLFAGVDTLGKNVASLWAERGEEGGKDDIRRGSHGTPILVERVQSGTYSLYLNRDCALCNGGPDQLRTVDGPSMTIEKVATADPATRKAVQLGTALNSTPARVWPD